MVLDGIIGPWFLHPFRRLKRPLHYIILRPALDVAIDRCRQRAGDTLTDPEPIRALYKQLSVLGEFGNHAIDTAGHAPDDTLAAVQAALVSGRFRLNTTI